MTDVRTLPGSRTRAVAAFALFAAVQVADGVMTFAGVNRSGVAVEGNPVLAFYMAQYGAGMTLISAKSIAIALAAVLHARAYYLALTVLTVVYVVATIDAWTWASW